MYTHTYTHVETYIYIHKLTIIKNTKSLEQVSSSNKLQIFN